MCGRFMLAVTPQELAEAFAVDPPQQLAPRYNIAPTQQVLTVRADAEGRRCWARARWGLVPSWAKERSIGARMINARAETVATKPAFRSAVKRRRCLIAAGGFYEWHGSGSDKQPYLIRFQDRRPFALAGLWERWQPGGEEPLETCTIITTEANEEVRSLHDRMPVILPPDRFDEWLAATPLADEALQRLLVPFPAAGMESLAVSRRLNDFGNDDPACIEPARLF